MTLWSSEWLLLRRDRSAWLVYVVFSIACAGALMDSVSVYSREARLHRELQAEEAERVRSLERALSTHRAAAAEPWNDPTNPGPVGRDRAATYAILPLADLAFLRTHPSPGTIVSVSTEGGALDRSIGDLGQPHVASLGRFDLGFLLLIVFPFVVLLLTFDVAVRDRQSGVARLLCSQETRMSARHFTRLTLRIAPLIAIACVTVTFAAALTGSLTVASPRDLAKAFVIVALSATFWGSLSLALQSWARTVAVSGILSLGAWAALVILVPTLVAVVVEASVPIPSRIERTSASREAVRRASLDGQEVLSRYLEGHPELAGARADHRDYYVRQVAVDAAVAAAREPVEQRFFRALERRAELTTRVSVASPVSLVARCLDGLAGASDTRRAHYRREVNDFQARFAAFFDEMTVRGERLDKDALTARPTFHLEPVATPGWPLLAFGAWTAASLALAVRRSRREARSSGGFTGQLAGERGLSNG